MPSVDLNCDLGEGVGDDAALFPVVTSANVACGFHAGDADTMRASCAAALRHGVAVGAHISYRDREGFGRISLDVAPDVLHAEAIDQIAELRRAAAEADTDVRYVKPHGALYNRIVHDPDQAEAIARACADASLPLLGLAGSAIEAAAGAHGVPFFREVFADRAYNADGTLVSRSVEGSVLHDPDEIAERVLRIVLERTVVAIDGAEVVLDPQSVCVHGDTPGAAAIARTVRERLAAAGVGLRSFL